MSAFGTGHTLPPPVPATLTFGGFWVRTGAYLIDAIILFTVNGILMSSVGAGMMTSSTDPNDLNVGPLFVATGLSMLIPALYTIGFWVSSGATPGKMALGLKVVRSDTGGPITTGQAIGRFFATFVSAVFLGLGFLWVGFDARKQGWHDKLASTVVVRRTAPTPAFHA